MPKVFVMAAVDKRRRPLLQAWGLQPPTEFSAEQLAAAAEEFGLGDVTDVALITVKACRGCGCTDDQACAEGCSWVPGDPDLCTACAAKGIR